jgi:hypothetical protein
LHVYHLSPTRTTSPTHLTLLDFIIIIILGEGYKLNSWLKKYKNKYNKTNQSSSEFEPTTLSSSFKKLANSTVFIHNSESIHWQKDLIPV